MLPSVSCGSGCCVAVSPRHCHYEEPTGSIASLNSAILAHLMLNERLNIFGVLGCALCIVGSCVIVLHAPPEREVGSLLEIWRLAMQPGARPAIIGFHCISIGEVSGRWEQHKPAAALPLSSNGHLPEALELCCDAKPMLSNTLTGAVIDRSKPAAFTHMRPKLDSHVVHRYCCRTRMRRLLPRRFPLVCDCRVYGNCFAHFRHSSSSWDIEHLRLCRHLFSRRVLVGGQLQGGPPGSVPISGQRLTHVCSSCGVARHFSARRHLELR